MGRATSTARRDSEGFSISIHALRGEGDVEIENAYWNIAISIHALRGEGDSFHFERMSLKRISIHALRGEGDQQSIL